MIAKLIVHAPTREAAAAGLSAASGAVEVWPVRTNAAFLARAAAHPEFVAGRIDTGFIARHAGELVPPSDPAPAIVAAAAAALVGARGSGPWDAPSGFRVNAVPDRRVAVEVGGRILVTEPAVGGVAREVGHERILFRGGEAWPFAAPGAGTAGGGAAVADGTILAPMPGRVIAVDVAAGDAVARGQRLLVLEAMKMEQAMLAPFDGSVAELKVAVGAQVSEGALLVRVEEAG